jgi:hypothetical protein
MHYTKCHFFFVSVGSHNFKMYLFYLGTEVKQGQIQFASPKTRKLPGVRISDDRKGDQRVLNDFFLL